jgi:ketosteroid isomerase-like protein
MRKALAVGVLIAFGGFFLAMAGQDAGFSAALEKYNTAFKNKDVETVKNLLAPDVLLYEHSVRNDGLQDVFENHLKPEILEFEDLKLEFSDLRVTPGGTLVLVTRQYTVQGTLRGREINARGNETMVWKKVDGSWKTAHIHYSHPCPRPPAPAKQQ